MISDEMNEVLINRPRSQLAYLPTANELGGDIDNMIKIQDMPDIAKYVKIFCTIQGEGRQSFGAIPVLTRYATIGITSFGDYNVGDKNIERHVSRTIGYDARVYGDNMKGSQRMNSDGSRSAYNEEQIISINFDTPTGSNIEKTIKSSIKDVISSQRFQNMQILVNHNFSSGIIYILSSVVASFFVLAISIILVGYILTRNLQDYVADSGKVRNDQAIAAKIDDVRKIDDVSRKLDLIMQSLQAEPQKGQKK